MSTLTLLHNKDNADSRKFKPLFGAIGDVIEDQEACVAFCPAFAGFPTVVYKGQTLFNPADMAAVTAWQVTVDNPPTPSPKRILSQFEFTQLFTSAERKAIRQQSKSNTDLEDLMAVLNAAQDVNLDLPILISGLAFLVSLGILTATRRDKILTGVAP